MSAALLSAGTDRDVRRGVSRRPCSLWEFVHGSGLRAVVLGPSTDPNAKVTILLVAPRTGRPVQVVKAPTTDGAARAVQAEAALLEELRRVGPRLALETVPHVLEMVEFDGRPALVTSALPGAPMSTLYLRWRHTASPSRVAADFAAVERWLAGFQRATAQDVAPLDMDGGVIDRLRSRFADVPGVAEDLAQLAYTCAVLAGATTPCTAVHGDLWSANVLVTGTRVTGIVDWEAGAISGEPVRDLVRFALAYALYLDRRTRPGARIRGHGDLRAGSWGAGIEHALNGSGWFPDLVRRFIGDGLRRLGASPTVWRDAALAGIAEVAAFADDEPFARRHLELFRRLAGSAGRGDRAP